MSKETGERYVWGGNCDGWHLVRSNELSVIQERMPPNSSEPAHLHVRSRQFFFVLSGTLSVLVDGSAQEIGPGKGVEIGPRIPHSVRSDSTSEAHFLVISSPPSHGDKVAIPE